MLGGREGGAGWCYELQNLRRHQGVQQVEGRAGWEEERGTGCSDARGHETSGWGRGWARQGTRASSSDSTAGSELHGCLPLWQVSAYKTPQSPRQQPQAVASPEVAALRPSGATPLALAWRSPALVTQSDSLLP